MADLQQGSGRTVQKSSVWGPPCHRVSRWRKKDRGRWGWHKYISFLLSHFFLLSVVHRKIIRKQNKPGSVVVDFDWFLPSFWFYLSWNVQKSILIPLGFVLFVVLEKVFYSIALVASFGSASFIYLHFFQQKNCQIIGWCTSSVVGAHPFGNPESATDMLHDVQLFPVAWKLADSATHSNLPIGRWNNSKHSVKTEARNNNRLNSKDNSIGQFYAVFRNFGQIIVPPLGLAPLLCEVLNVQ